MADEASLIGESSAPTIEINIKTLDSQSHTLRVNKDLPVSALKEKIVNLIGLPVEQQRLIFRGRVLQDDHLLSAYHIEDGHTLHLVARQPAQTQPGTEDAVQNNGNDSTGAPHRNGQISHSVVLGSLNIADTGEGMAADIGRLVGAVLNSLGGGNLTSTGGAGNTSSTSSNQSRPNTEAEATQNASGRAQSGNAAANQPFQPPQASYIPRFTALPESLSTLSEFVNRMERVLQYDGSQFLSVDNRDSPRSDLPSLNSRGMPTPNALRAVLLQVQQLLSGIAASALSHIAGRLEREGSSTDPEIRGQIQSEAMHVGVAMQHLGAMFLELGRTIMTLRMGPSPSEALVNSGPAVYISPRGPNPIMVQPSPVQTSSLFGIPSPSVLTGISGPFGVGDPSRNVSIQIHAGTSAPSGVSSAGSRINLGGASLGESTNVQQTSTRENGSSDSAPTRGLPSRTVLASVPPRSGAETSRHLLSVIYPVQVRSQLSVPIHSSSVQASQSSGVVGAQPNTVNPVTEPSSESNATSTLVAQINAQIARALSGNHHGPISNSSSTRATDSQDSHPSMPNVAQPNLDSQFPPTLSEAGSISSLVTQLTSQFANALSGNNQGPSSSPSVHGAGISCATEGSQVVGPASVSSAIVENDLSHQDVSSTGSDSSRKSFVGDNMSDSTRQQPLPENLLPSDNTQPSEGTNMESTSRSVDCPGTSRVTNTVFTEQQGSQSSVQSTNSNTTVQTQATNSSGSGRTSPLGLGLGGLQPKRRGKPAKPIGKDGISNSPSVSQNQQSIARGQQVLRSLVAQNSEMNRENTNGSSTLLPSGTDHITDAMPLGEQGDNDHIDGSMISQALRSPLFSGLLSGVAQQTGLGSPASLTNMLEQCTRSPEFMNTVNQTMQQVGQSDEIGGLLSGMARGNGGIDFSRMIQQMMPVVSQALGGGRNFPAPVPSLQSESLDRSAGGNSIQDDRDSQIDVVQAVQRIEQQDSPGNVFRTMLDSAGRLLGEGSGFEDLVQELGNNMELTDEFMELFQHGINQRLQTESVPEDKS